ncbi:hypothetical protein KY311_01485, partial [Candidatus Woesearchaeota archaeon]|nr:hypothetical protein [Candidatus Woesearchaeota archaeon]
IFIKENAGYRVGVCMKGFEEKLPVIVVGGDVKDFLGEYMSGGRIIVLGKAGNYIGTGMHGGIVFIKGKLEQPQLGFGAVIEELTDWDKNEIKRCLGPFCKNFNIDINKINADEFTKVVPLNNRPYMNKYC